MTAHNPIHTPLPRRRALATGGSALAALLVAVFFPGRILASPRDAKEKLAELTGGATGKKGRVHLKLPEITESGPLVPVTATVDSPMTAADHVKTIHIVAERNSVPEVASFHLNPHAGKAEVTTRIRLVESQVVIAAAEMNDGSVFIGKARTKVAAGAGGCG